LLLGRGRGGKKEGPFFAETRSKVLLKKRSTILMGRRVMFFVPWGTLETGVKGKGKWLQEEFSAFLGKKGGNRKKGAGTKEAPST